MTKKIILLHFSFFFAGILFSNNLYSQINKQALGDTIFENGDLNSQFEYVITNSRTYVNNKVVKIDWLNKLKSNTLSQQKEATDVLAKKTTTINQLKSEVSSLKSDLENEKETLAVTQHQVDNIFFLGADMAKSTFILLFWGISGLLTLLLLYFIYKFKNSNTTTKLAQKELLEAREGYEELRKKKMEKEQELMRKLQDEINRNA